MTTITQNKKDEIKTWLLELYRLNEEKLNGHRDHPLAHFRKTAYEQLQKMDFPSRRDEDWKYTSVQPILNTRYKVASRPGLPQDDPDKLLMPGIRSIRLVFINGYLVKDLSGMDQLPKNLEFKLMGDALKDERTKKWVKEMISLEGGTGQNTFLPLNQAFSRHGIFINIPVNEKIELPIHLIHLNSAEKEAHFSHPQIFIRCQTGSEATIIESYQATNNQSNYFTNAAKWIELDPNARLSHYRVQLESLQAFQINNTIVRQRRDSVFSSYAADLGGQIIRNNLSSTIVGEGAQTNYYGIYVGKGHQHIDNQTYIDHAVPNCQSNELYKGVLTDNSRGVFNGKVMVRQDAQKTNAFQQNSSLVLSPTAIMDAKPQLEIYADDVRCSHGATIGQLDEDSVFYLRSRGISEDMARKMLQQAFVGEVLEHMDHKEIKELMQKLVYNWLNSSF